MFYLTKKLNRFYKIIIFLKTTTFIKSLLFLKHFVWFTLIQKYEEASFWKLLFKKNKMFILVLKDYWWG